MTFSISHLSVLAYARGFTLWHYKAGAPIEDALRPDYFRQASDMMMAGDVILVSARDGARILTVVDGEGGFVTAAMG